MTTFMGRTSINFKIIPAVGISIGTSYFSFEMHWELLFWKTFFYLAAFSLHKTEAAPNIGTDLTAFTKMCHLQLYATALSSTGNKSQVSQTYKPALIIFPGVCRRFSEQRMCTGKRCWHMHDPSLNDPSWLGQVCCRVAVLFRGSGERLNGLYRNVARSRPYFSTLQFSWVATKSFLVCYLVVTWSGCWWYGNWNTICKKREDISNLKSKKKIW